MDPQMMDKVAQELPSELVAIVQAVGFGKIAAQLLDVNTSSEHAVYEKIGTDLFMRRIESALVQRGLRAYTALGDGR